MGQRKSNESLDLIDNKSSTKVDKKKKAFTRAYKITIITANDMLCKKVEPNVAESTVSLAESINSWKN